MERFLDLNKDTWKTYKNLILNSENIFPMGIRCTRAEYDYLMKKGTAIGKILLLDDTYVGNVIGEKLDRYIRMPNFDVGKLKSKKTIYMESIVVEPQYQNQGYGRKLMQELISDAKSQGFEYIVGHYRKRRRCQPNVF